MDWLDQSEIEWTYGSEVEKLRLGAGAEIHGDAMLAVAKGLLQSGVSYLGGYQGAPVAYLMDLFAEARDILDEHGVHFQASANEASAAAMLGASINYPVRGAVTFKSVAGTAVASDALSNLASAGVVGGALIIVGVDFGEGSNVGQERTQASAMKSQIWLMDPRPDVGHIAHMVEKGFELSEASNTPVMLELRIRACHVTGTFTAKDNRRGRYSSLDPIEAPDWSYDRLVLPPATFAQEAHKIEHRLPDARAFILDQNLNELSGGSLDDIGIIVQGGLHNSVMGGLRELGLADIFGDAQVPVLTLNVVYPLVPEQITDFCAGKRAVLMVEEGQPDFIEQAVHVILRKADLQTTVVGKGVLPTSGEYTPQAILDGLARFLAGAAPAGLDQVALAARHRELTAHAADPAPALEGQELSRPPGFCTGCPERPVFSALKLLERETGRFHISADIGCHLYSSLPPFNMSNTILGYGLGLASSTGVEPNFSRRVISTMGDGAFWHNGLNSGVVNAVYNKDDAVLLIFDNGYTASTGAQRVPSAGVNRAGEPVRMSIEAALRGVGVSWIRRVHSYGVSKVMKALREAVTTAQGGLKVVIAEGECRLAIARRQGPQDQERLAAGGRIKRTRFGVDADLCTGDHSCIRLSGCPSLTVKPNPDPLRRDPVVQVVENCVGCGLCGEVAHAAVLCPSFYRARIVHNPGRWESMLHRARGRIIGWLQPREAGAS